MLVFAFDCLITESAVNFPTSISKGYILSIYLFRHVLPSLQTCNVGLRIRPFSFFLSPFLFLFVFFTKNVFPVMNNLHGWFMGAFDFMRMKKCSLRQNCCKNNLAPLLKVSLIFLTKCINLENTVKVMFKTSLALSAC